MILDKQHNLNELYFSKKITRNYNKIIEYPLTIITAPMGYGKTTATRAWLRKSNVKYLWQCVYSDSKSYFWREFTKLFYEIDQKYADLLREIGFPENLLVIREVCEIIESIQFQTPLVFVIDDYHLIEDNQVNNFIEFLSRCEIEHLHIILTARYIRFSNLEELCLKGYIYQISQETFEFSQEDIRKYYKLCGITVGLKESKLLKNYTEGWVSALYLSLLDYVEQGRYTPEENIYKLLDKAVYAPQSEEMKHFLMSLCLVDGFSYDQASFLWGHSNTHGLLNELVEKNAFVVYDSRTKLYNIHSIFVGFLRELFELQEAEYICQRNQRTGRWFLKQGDSTNAMFYFYLCKDFDSILTAMETDQANNYKNSYKDMLIKYMSECPKEIKSKHYYALLLYAIHLFVNKEILLFQKNCEEFVEYLSADKDLDSKQRDQLQGEFELILSISEFNDLRRMSKRQRRSWELLGKHSDINYKVSNWCFGSPSILCLYYSKSGRLDEQTKLLQESIPYYYRLTRGHGSGGEYVMEAEVYFNRGDFDNAEISIQKAYLKAKEGKEKNIVLISQFIRLRILFMKGDIGNCLKLIDDLYKGMGKRKLEYPIEMIEMCENYLYAYMSQNEKIVEGFEKYYIEAQYINFPAVPFFNIVHGRQLLIEEAYLELIGSSESFLSIASVLPNLLGQIYTYIYLAAAYRKIFRDKEAYTSIMKALELAMPDQLFMCFVENCDFIKPLLEEVVLKGQYQEEIYKIFDLSEIFKLSKEAIIEQYFKVKKYDLTPREMEIAELAALGQTNAEIGKALFISTNTVKKAIKSIYTKLSINNRTLLRQYLIEHGVQIDISEAVG